MTSTGKTLIGRSCGRRLGAGSRATERALPPRRPAGCEPACAACAKMYFRYSENSSLAVALLDHHGSARSRSVTTGNGTSATPGS